MKVLIVDDCANKIRKLRQHITNIVGLKEDNILVAQCAVEAMAHLRSTAVDLLILDVLLPYRAGDDPKDATSLGLLDELHLTETYVRPRFIIGLTAFETALEKVESKFSKYLWTVIHFDETNDEWLQRVENIIEYLKSPPAQSVKEYQTDLCVITALPKEMKAIKSLPWDWEPARPIDDSTFVHEGSFKSNGKEFSVAAAVAPRMGMVDTAILAANLIYRICPKFIVMTGICAGLKDKVNFGDVILANPVWDYQSGKYSVGETGSIFAIAPHQLDVAAEVASRARLLAQDISGLSSIKAKWPDPPETSLQMVIAPVATGSAVIADTDIVRAIKSQRRDLAGIEMETYGLYAAACQASRPKPFALSLKSVCDFADARKDDSYQAYASYTSAEVMRLFFETYMHELESILAGS